MIEYNIISNNLYLFIVLAMIIALAIDMILGELPTRIHPVVIMGSLISFFKGKFIGMKNRISGLLVVVCVCISSAVILYVIYLIAGINDILLFLVFTILLSSTFSVKMLLDTASDVEKALNEDINRARQLVSYLVSRDTEELTESLIVSAAIESLSENITDSYVAPVFYYFVFAAVMLIWQGGDCLFCLLLVPVLYRISNTLDAMLGYETDELKDIGYVPAKTDDVLNYIPARIAGVFVVISAYLLRMDGKNAYRIMRRDARNCPSPNSGYTMASTAGALNIQLVKKETYILGDDNKSKTSDDIKKAVRLSRLSIILFTITIILLFTIIYMII
jgi:adenosylcobinamide-phosphate synthase